MANLAKRPVTFQYKDSRERTYLHEDTHNDNPSFKKDGIMWDDAINKVFCVLPKLNNDRIIKQDGAFLIYGMGNTKAEMAHFPDQPSEIIIKAHAKEGILKELKLIGIDRASMYPEMDKVMQQIKQEYSGGEEGEYTR